MPINWFIRKLFLVYNIDITVTVNLYLVVLVVLLIACRLSILRNRQLVWRWVFLGWNRNCIDLLDCWLIFWFKGLLFNMIVGIHWFILFIFLEVWGHLPLTVFVVIFLLINLMLIIRPIIVLVRVIILRLLWERRLIYFCYWLI